MISGGTSPLIMHRQVDRQVISCISKGSQNTLIYNFITTFDCLGNRYFCQGI